MIVIKFMFQFMKKDQKTLNFLGGTIKFQEHFIKYPIQHLGITHYVKLNIT